jgi:superfamily II DNA or RNA helicase
MKQVPTLRWDRGTILAEHVPPELLPDTFRYDARVRLHRAPAIAYHGAALALHKARVEWVDEARAYAVLDRPHKSDRTPRHYQAEALAAWKGAGRRGVVVLPTGSGKSFVAELCIRDAGRSALVVVPTIDLMSQWYDQLARAFGEPIGLLGGGHFELEDITVSTYDSAWMKVEYWGARFGTLVFDEVHHLPGPSYGSAATASLAPFRLGLTATFERPDGAHEEVYDLIGPMVYRKGITELSGNFLAEYRTEVLTVHLSDEDRAAYEDAHHNWRSFLDEEGIRLGGRNGWNNFLRASARSKRGREAFRAWRRSRTLLDGAPAKLRLVAELLRKHHGARTIIFTNDNASAYEVSRRLLVPAITHQTDIKERRATLAAFSDGSLPTVVTSRVLNEGVDVPEAEVAIVMSGTATVREHVQRLGRILRPSADKQAILYELVVADSSEERRSERRRDHDAYREAPPGSDA